MCPPNSVSPLSTFSYSAAVCVASLGWNSNNSPLPPYSNLSSVPFVISPPNPGSRGRVRKWAPTFCFLLILKPLLAYVHCFSHVRLGTGLFTESIGRARFLPDHGSDFHPSVAVLGHQTYGSIYTEISTCLGILYLLTL